MNRPTRMSPEFAFAVALIAGAAVFGWFEGASGPGGLRYPDVYLFARAGSTLVSSQWSHTFDFSWIQAGPLELALVSLARDAGPGDRGFAIALDMLSTAAIALAAVCLLRRRPVGLLCFAAGAIVVALPASGYRGHPAEAVIAALWLLAARAARGGRPTQAGLLVGISGCFELWGVLGVTVLMLERSPRRCIRGVALAVALPALSLLPFALGGDFHMFDFQWDAMAGVPRLLLGYEQPFTWPMRLAQGTIVVVAGTFCARALRRLPESVWIVPLVTILVRIGLDPVDLPYYWTAPLAFLLVGAAAIAADPGALRARIGGRFPSLAAPDLSPAAAQPSRRRRR